MWGLNSPLVWDLKTMPFLSPLLSCFLSYGEVFVAFFLNNWRKILSLLQLNSNVCLFPHSRIPKHVTDGTAALYTHTELPACLPATQQPCQRDGLCDQHRREFYSQQLNCAEKRGAFLSSPRRRETLGQQEHLSHPAVARSHHVKSNPPIRL